LCAASAAPFLGRSARLCILPPTIYSHFSRWAAGSTLQALAPNFHLRAAQLSPPPATLFSWQTLKTTALEGLQFLARR